MSKIANIIYDAATGDAPHFRAYLGHWFSFVESANDYNQALYVFCKYFPGTGCGDAVRFREISENHQRIFMLLVAMAEGATQDRAQEGVKK